MRTLAVVVWAVLRVGVEVAAGGPPVPAESWEAGMVIIVEDKPGLATEQEPIFLASNHVGWNPGDPSMRLTQRSDSRWQIVLAKPEEDLPPLRFKFTRGNWDLVEIAEDMSDIPNRELPEIDPEEWEAGRPVVLEFTVEKWADEKPEVAARRALDPYRRIEAVGDLRRVQVVGGGGPARGMSRDLLVWLPPGYDDRANAGREYPVLYLMDGQNLFEKLPSIPGEWGVDETLAQSIELGVLREMIVVGVPHAGSYRANEYLPFAAYGYEPYGLEFVSFLRGEVMPRVERAFRVSTAREETGIGGASLGAVISLFAWLVHPEEFGLLLLESTAQLGADSSFWVLLEEAEWLPERVSIGVGTREAGEEAEPEVNRHWVLGAERLHGWFVEEGMSEAAVELTVQGNGVHNEAAWGRRFGAAVQHLFGKPEE